MKKEIHENKMKVFRKKQPSKTWDGGLKEKLEKGGAKLKDAPTGRSPSGVVRKVLDKVKGMQEGEVELQRRKKLTVESEGKFYWKAQDESHSLENVSQENIRKFRKVQFRDIDNGPDQVQQQHPVQVRQQHYELEDDHAISKPSQESFVQQVIFVNM